MDCGSTVQGFWGLGFQGLVFGIDSRRWEAGGSWITTTLHPPTRLNEALNLNCVCVCDHAPSLYSLGKALPSPPFLCNIFYKAYVQCSIHGNRDNMNAYPKPYTLHPKPYTLNPEHDIRKPLGYSRRLELPTSKP